MCPAWKVAHNERERGSAVPLVAAVLAVAALAMLGLVRLGRAAVERAEAQAAADAAALAGLFEGERGAADLARRNQGRLVAFGGEADVVWVEVVVGGARARATARYDWEPLSEQAGNPGRG